MTTASGVPAGIAFGRFLLLPHRRELFADGQPVKLGGRAFDVLMALIEVPGAVVSKDALMARVWPDRVVEENNLQWQISTLRAAFGADRNLIRTVAGRGYQFTGEVRVLPPGQMEPPGDGSAVAPPEAVLPPTNLPEPVSELVGRADVLGEILSLAAAHRLVTLTGAGGIGKTRLALAAARRLLPQFADGVWLAEFSPIADPGLVPVAVATALGLDLGGGKISAPRVAAALADKRLVLVLDTCEHMIGAAAALAEAALRAGGTPHVLATSREPLRAEGEWVYHVPPLALPATDLGYANDALAYGAVQLFVERLRAAEPHFALDSGVAATITAICRRLDGIPLAIELAAARAAVLGVEEVAANLDNRFRILTGGRRTALPRHQTLRATLDWSYELLSEPEREILRRLAVFAGVFRLEAARVVIAGREIAPAAVVDGIANLVAKSLVAVAAGGTVARYRLLDTTRAYALEKLAESGDYEWLARRHAEYYRDLFQRAEADFQTRPTAEWLAEYAPKIDNLRAALDWAFSLRSDAALGTALTAAAVPLWMQLSLAEECHRRVGQALAALAGVAEPDARLEMELLAASGASRLYTSGGAPEVAAAWTKAFELAKSLGDTEYQVRSLWGLWGFQLATGEWRLSFEIAQRFATLAADRADPNDRAIADRMIGFSQHYLGDQASACEHVERMLINFVPTAGRSHDATRFQFDQRVSAGAMHARILWLRGFPNRARRAAESTVEDARATNAVSMCYALALGACPVGIWSGDASRVEHYTSLLLDYSRRHALPTWRLPGLCFQGALLMQGGDLAGGLRMLRTGFDQAGEGLFATIFAMNHLMFRGEMAAGLGRAGQVAEGLAEAEQAIKRAEGKEEGWLLGELLRIKGELLLLQDAPGAAAAAEELFRQALDWARRQGALSWELRAATSLARLRRDQGHLADALALLQPVYDRFTEGFETADLKAAKGLLDVLL
jgi:predicted ATPase/DNA-binding winged helix-turn-helix (wHTH) protein